ncbi:GspH/FimT family pseudopilin [Pseudomonas phoenicis]|uniref:GspH/FimT family pseudopilin n=1 Tax=unclassified Pseudomonas TaxID=196821 RepID=UPI00399F9121
MKQQGATLIQMMLALALIGVLTQLAAPAYTAIRHDLHLASAARELAQALRYARNHAALLGQSVQVAALEGDWGNGWQIVLPPQQQVLRERRLAQGLRIVSNGGNRVTFSALGVPLGPGASPYGATLTLCQHRQAISAQQVVIAFSGRIDLRTEPQTERRCATR